MSPSLSAWEQGSWGTSLCSSFKVLWCGKAYLASSAWFFTQKSFCLCSSLKSLHWNWFFCFPSRKKKTEPLAGRLSTLNELIISAAMATEVICWNAHCSTRPLEAAGTLSCTDRDACWCTGGLPVLKSLDPHMQKGVKTIHMLEMFANINMWLRVCKHKYVVEGFKHTALILIQRGREMELIDKFNLLKYK